MYVCMYIYIFSCKFERILFYSLRQNILIKISWSRGFFLIE